MATEKDLLLSELSNKIIKISFFCTDSLNQNLEEKYGKDTKEFLSKHIQVLFEFTCFSLHITSRSAFKQLGQEKRNELQDKLFSVFKPQNENRYLLSDTAC